MRKSSQNSKCSLRGRWCVAPCSRFQAFVSEPPPSGSLADQIAPSGRALTAGELAQALSLSVVTVFKLARRGIIPCVRIGTSVRFCPNAIARWLREHGG